MDTELYAAQKQLVRKEITWTTRICASLACGHLSIRTKSVIRYSSGSLSIALQCTASYWFETITFSTRCVKGSPINHKHLDTN